MKKVVALVCDADTLSLETTNGETVIRCKQTPLLFQGCEVPDGLLGMSIQDTMIALHRMATRRKFELLPEELVTEADQGMERLLSMPVERTK
jgi:hypothetical protein